MKLFLQFCFPPSDSVDKVFHFLLPLPAIWGFTACNLTRQRSDILRSHAPICLVVPKVCCRWALHSQRVASTHSLA